MRARGAADFPYQRVLICGALGAFGGAVQIFVVPK
jgi:hypothetical protein